MLEIKKTIDDLIADKEYDERLVPYIKAFFLYNANQFGWNKETIQNKIALLSERIKGIEFVGLKDRLAFTDFKTGNILINQNLLEKKLSSLGTKKLTSEIFERFEIATKPINKDLLKFYEKDPMYFIENLKYSTNQQDKESIIRFVSCAFNIRPKEIYNLNTTWQDKLENMDISNKEEKNFLEDTKSTMLPGVANAVSQIMNSKTDNEKANAYLNLYAISLLALNYRLDNKQENKEIIKSQYETINEEFAKKAEKYVITADKLKQHSVSNGWMIDIEKNSDEINERLMSVQAKDLAIMEIDDFKREISTYPMPTTFQEQPLEDVYLEQQVDQILHNYEEKFRPIIQEYFRRSAKIFGWTKDEFDKKIKNYQIAVKKINFTKKVHTDDKNIIAYWAGNHIDIKNDLAYINTKTLLSTFFHEQEHATDNTTRNEKEIENGLANESSNLNEYATEIGAVHLVGEKLYDDQFCFTHRMKGYDDFKFAGSMMAAALGISEFEFAKLKDKGEDIFNKTLEERFGYIDIENVMLEFNEILSKIKKAPSIFHMKELSEAYAQMYNLANKIILPRIAHESKDIMPNDFRIFRIKSNYEMTKIAKNMNLAKRKLHLKNKYMQPIIVDKTTLQSYSKISNEDKKEYMELLRYIYPETNVSFDNKPILRHLNRYFKHSIKGKIVDLFNKSRRPVLQEEPVKKSLPSSIQRKIFKEELLKKGEETIVVPSKQEMSDKLRKNEEETRGE